MPARNGKYSLDDLSEERVNGADANSVGRDGHTPLMLAARSGHPPIVTALLNGGADVYARNPSNGNTALMLAANAGARE